MAIPTMRQVAAAKEEMGRLIRLAAREYAATIPNWGWKRQDDWRKAHPAPWEKTELKVNAYREKLNAAAEALLFEARMGRITADELAAKVKTIGRG